MEIETLPLDALHAHPHNCNAMPAPLRRKLATHLQRTGRYPPLIVRRLKPVSSSKFQEFQVAPGVATSAPLKLETVKLETPTYQILDGHHRAAALRAIGCDTARCVIWDVDDDEALLLLATLNRLQGADDPRRRGALLKTLRDRRPSLPLAALLPDSRERIARLLTLVAPPPPPLPPRDIEHMPVPVHFFLLPARKRALDARLRALGGSREDALMRLVDEAGS